MLTYSELIQLKTFEERLEYLKGHPQAPSEFSHGSMRDLKQRFYNSKEWKRVRDFVIARDFGYDLGIPGRHILDRILVHHMNPVQPQDLYIGKISALDPEYLITVSHRTHLGIHFEMEISQEFPLERIPGDTKLW